MLSLAVKLSHELVSSARIMAKASHRSVAKQIEHWAQIGKIAEENPDLPVEMIKGILISDQEARAGKLKPYSFDD